MPAEPTAPTSTSTAADEHETPQEEQGRARLPAPAQEEQAMHTEMTASPARPEIDAPENAVPPRDSAAKHAESSTSPPHTPTDGAGSPAREARTETRTAHAGQKRPASRPQLQLEDQRRGKRMLGLLNSTLTQSREPRKRVRTEGETEAPAPQRPVVPTVDLAAERAAHDAERASIRKDLERAHTLAEDLAAYEAAYRTARSQKRRLSSYLVTHIGSSSAARPPADEAEAAATALAREPSVPIALRGARAYDVYYLPRKLLPEQEDVLDAQEEATDDILDRADDEYDRVRAEMERELDACKARLRQHNVDPRSVPQRRAW